MIGQRMMELMNRTAQTITAITLALCVAIAWGTGVFLTVFLSFGWVLVLFIGIGLLMFFALIGILL